MNANVSNKVVPISQAQVAPKPAQDDIQQHVNEVKERLALMNVFEAFSAQRIWLSASNAIELPDTGRLLSPGVLINVSANAQRYNVKPAQLAAAFDLVKQNTHRGDIQYGAVVVDGDDVSMTFHRNDMSDIFSESVAKAFEGTGLSIHCSSREYDGKRVRQFNLIADEAAQLRLANGQVIEVAFKGSRKNVREMDVHFRLDNPDYKVSFVGGAGDERTAFVRILELEV